MKRFESAKEIYSSIGVDVEKAIDTLKNIPVSLHCWQGDDVKGFDTDGPLTGGIQTTGNYPGRARTPEELMQDMDKVQRSLLCFVKLHQYRFRQSAYLHLSLFLILYRYTM